MRVEKQAIVSELRAALGQAGYLFLADFRGLRSRQAEELRRRLARLNARFYVVKNTYVRRALEGHAWMRCPDGLAGPTGVIYGGGDPVEAAKLVSGFQQELRVLAVKHGLMPGLALGPAELDALAKLPPRPVLLAQVVGTLAAPLSRMAGVLHQALAGLVRVLRAARDKRELA